MAIIICSFLIIKYLSVSVKLSKVNKSVLDVKYHSLILNAKISF